MPGDTNQLIRFKYLHFNEMAQTFTNTSKLVSFISNLNRSFHDSFRIHERNLKNPTITFKRWKGSACWKCGAQSDMSQIFCPKCNVIQRPRDTQNYFKVFELEEKFDVDQQALRSKFRQLQGLLHPDKFSNSTDVEQTISADYSSLLNKAYSNLHVPLKRAEHLLKLRGEPIGEGQTVNDPEFLIEVMSLNEEVEETGQDLGELKELNEKNNGKIEKLSKEIDDCFKNGDIKKAKENIIKLKYFASLSNRINGVLRELGETD